MKIHFTTDDGELLETIEIDVRADDNRARQFCEAEILSTFRSAWNIIVARAERDKG